MTAPPGRVGSRADTVADEDATIDRDGTLRPSSSRRADTLGNETIQRAALRRNPLSDNDFGFSPAKRGPAGNRRGFEAARTVLLAAPSPVDLRCPDTDAVDGRNQIVSG